MITETLTVESLARAIHEDWVFAHAKVTGVPAKVQLDGNIKPCPDWDNLNEMTKNIRRMQARLMMERIMR